MPWAGHSIRCDLTELSGGIGNWSVAPSRAGWYHASHPCSSRADDAREVSEPLASQEPEVAVDLTATGKKNQHRNTISSTSVLAGGAAGCARVVGALDHTAALLASVVRAAPTSSAPVFV